MLEGSRMFVLPYPTPSRTPVEQPRKGNGELVAGFFGHWYGGKDLELLVTAVADLASESPPTRLRLWGTPLNELSQRYERRVRRRLRDLGHPDAVELAGWLEDSRIEAELGSCDVVVLPYEQPSSRAELASVSGVLFDAFSLGIPVVATDVRALADSLHHEVNGLLVPAGNRQALTGALRRLRDDSELREHLALGARETGAQSNLESAVSTLERHYERLLGVSSRDPVVAA
jgi:glycosyltransferase involved in cell wall biosynthesis